MAHRTRLLCALALVSLAACSKPEEGGETSPLRVQSSSATVKANGTASVTIHVEGGAPGAVVVNTSLGAFTSGLQSVTMDGTPFDVPLRPCNSQLNADCAGVALVSVVDSAATMRTAQVKFSQVERCSGGVDDDEDGRTDCADSDECGIGATCAPFGKTCGGDAACSVCNVPSGVSAEASEQSCDDGHDNDCDGKVDCADPDCANDVCTTTTQVNGNDVLGACKMTGTGAAQTGTCVCTPLAGGEATAATCGNGRDDDCDGLVDCEDGVGTTTAPNAHCQPVGSVKGPVCDLRGNTCSAGTTVLASTCSVCSGNGGVAQATESACGDAKDNDCDGFVDCADTDCAAAGYVCDTTGKKCTIAGACVCLSAEAGREVSCGDGQDNDCDGAIDCADADCRPPAGSPTGTLGAACNGFGSFCNTVATGACVCSGNGGPTADEKLLLCGDGRDNDCDGQTDCGDLGCHPVGSGLGGDCDADATMSGNYCSALSQCVCSGNGGAPEPAGEVSCSDTKDNDCDAKVDCADPTCADQACSTTGKLCANGTCSLCTGNGGTPQPIETICGDAHDNDCDGLVDCADTQCTGQTCPALATDNVSPTVGKCVAASGQNPAQCKCTPVAEVCKDGVDNDCDGKIDCADADCQPVGNVAGKVCDNVGHTCSPPAMTGGVSVCGVVCSGNSGIVQASGSESSCFDGADNDCNGLADCQDPNCAEKGLSCSATGKTCSDTDFQCVCRKPEAGGETTCYDGADNDCDGLADCKDPNCQTAVAECGAQGYGFACSAAGGGTCACTGNGGAPQPAKETSCQDGADNDCDGAKDCLDVDCRPTAVGSYGQGCGSTTEAFFGFRCSFLGRCVCSKGETTEATCGDAVDNDCDGLADCNDPDCQPVASGVLGQSCSSTGLTCLVDGNCAGCSGNGGTAESSESECFDGYDNDCDGFVDCGDPQCVNRQCYAESTNFKCTQLAGGERTCIDGTTNYSMVVTAAKTRLAANGLSTTTVTATLKTLVSGALQPLANSNVTFAVTGNGSVSPASGTTNGAGQVTVTFTSSLDGGAAKITASHNSGSAVTSGSVTIEQPTLAQVKLVSTQYQVMGARYSAFQETNLLTFQLLDNLNVPYPEGLQVYFTHQSIGDSYIGAVEDCSLGAPRTCSASAITDAQGYVRVLLHSGTVANVVSVEATASAGGVTIVGSASQLAVVGAKASGAKISVFCTPQNVPGYTDHDCTNSRYGGPLSLVTCTVALADRFNNVLGVSTLATFESEGGSAGPPATTPAYDPKKQPTAQTGLGRAKDYVAVTGYKLPRDVPPFADEYSLTYDDGAGCGVRTHNPRDGLSTIIVRVNGEEGFVDGSNGRPANGTYDLGENFIDLAEPFVDMNDNGTHDDGEPYTDVDSDDGWDAPNGVWDAQTVIWAETRVVYSGFQLLRSVGGLEYGSRIHSLGEPVPAPTPTSTFLVKMGNDYSVPPYPTVVADRGFFSTDTNFNPPSSLIEYETGLAGSDDRVDAEWIQSPNSIDDLGLGFSQLYCRTRTPADLAVDCDAAECKTTPCYVFTNIGRYSYGHSGTIRIYPYWSCPSNTLLLGVESIYPTQAGSLWTTLSAAGSCVMQP